MLRAAQSVSVLAEALTERARLTADGPDARRDLAEVARIFAETLSMPDRAIEVWRALRDRFGCDSESFEALADLLSRSERWQELVSLLSEEALGPPLRKSSSSAAWPRCIETIRGTARRPSPPTLRQEILERPPRCWKAEGDRLPRRRDSASGLRPL